MNRQERERIKAAVSTALTGICLPVLATGYLLTLLPACSKHHPNGVLTVSPAAGQGMASQGAITPAPGPNGGSQVRPGGTNPGPGTPGTGGSADGSGDGDDPITPADQAAIDRAQAPANIDFVYWRSSVFVKNVVRDLSPIVTDDKISAAADDLAKRGFIISSVVTSSVALGYQNVGGQSTIVTGYQLIAFKDPASTSSYSFKAESATEADLGSKAQSLGDAGYFITAIAVDRDGTYKLFAEKDVKAEDVKYIVRVTPSSSAKLGSDAQAMAHQGLIPLVVYREGPASFMLVGQASSKRKADTAYDSLTLDIPVRSEGAPAASITDAAKSGYLMTSAVRADNMIRIVLVKDGASVPTYQQLYFGNPGAASVPASR